MATRPKPKPKRDIAVMFSSEDQGVIYFYAVPDAVQGLDEYGEVEPWSPSGSYRMRVNGLFEFDDVVKYLESYG
jgi:hypothetical protein